MKCTAKKLLLRMGHGPLSQPDRISVRGHDGSDLQRPAVVKEDLRSHGRNLVPSICIHLRRVATRRGSEKCADREGCAQGRKRTAQKTNLLALGYRS